MMCIPEHLKEASPSMTATQSIRTCVYVLMDHLMNSNDDVTIKNNTTTIMCPVTPAPVIMMLFLPCVRSHASQLQYISLCKYNN